MRGKTCRLIMVVLLTSLLSSVLHVAPVFAQAQKGPRSVGVEFAFYATPENCYQALLAGSIDIMPYSITRNMYDAIITNPQILLAPNQESNEIHGFSLNINASIDTYRAIESPLYDEVFRKAIAYLVNKNTIVSDIFEHFADRTDVPFPKTQNKWWNTSITYPNYPYEFDPVEAATILYDAGFRDLDSDGIRNYPPDWPGLHGMRPNLHPLVFYYDQSDPKMVGMAGTLNRTLVNAGIPVDFRPRTPHELNDPIRIRHDYHIYVGSQVTYRVPIWWCMLATYVYVYASFGQQYVYAQLWKHMPTIQSILYDNGLGGLLDKALYSSNLDEMVSFIKNAQSNYVNHVYEIAVCSERSYIAYRRNIAGVANEDGYSLGNEYTYLNVYRVDNPSLPIVIGLVNQPTSMNILHSDRAQNYECLDRIYAGLISCSPYDTQQDQPWVAQDWYIGTWFDEETLEYKTFVDYWFRKDVYWVTPVTGSIDSTHAQFTAKDYEFTCNYIYAQEPYIEGLAWYCPHVDRFSDIHHVEIIDDYHARVFMDVSSCWAYLWPTYPLLPKHKWLRAPLAINTSADFNVDFDIQLPGGVPLETHVVSGREDTRIRVRLDDGSYRWLNWGTDFRWKKGDLYIDIDEIDGLEINRVWVYYWKNGQNYGIYPGDLPWTDILEGCGTHYVKNIDMSNWLYCESNRNFFLETPLLGEIDWTWNWGTGAKPRSGYYKIDIFDVVRVTGAYGTKGYGGPDPKWFPGADLGSYDVGHIGINDLICVTSNNGKKFGQPP